MPRFRDHRHPRYQHPTLEQYRPPGVDRRLLRGLAWGLAFGTAMWVVAIAATYFAYGAVAG